LPHTLKLDRTFDKNGFWTKFGLFKFSTFSTQAGRKLPISTKPLNDCLQYIPVLPENIGNVAFGSEVPVQRLLI